MSFDIIDKKEKDRTRDFLVLVDKNQEAVLTCGHCADMRSKTEAFGVKCLEFPDAEMAITWVKRAVSRRAIKINANYPSCQHMALIRDYPLVKGYLSLSEH